MFHLLIHPIPSLGISALDILLETVALVAVVFMTVYLAISWRTMPERVAIHFGISGKPDDWGSKKWFVVVVVIAWIGYVSQSVAWFTVPRPYWPVTKANFEGGMIEVVKAGVMCVLAYAIVQTIKVAQGKAEGIGKTAIVLILLFMAIMFGYIFFVQRAIGG